MDSPAAAMTPSRKPYWLSLAALVVAIPAALAAETWQDISAWRSQHLRQPVAAEAGRAIDYAGARWTVTRFTRLPGQDGTAAVLVEFEAMMPDPKAFAANPCEVRLADGAGRTWQPTLFADPVVGKTYPETASLGLCGGPTFAATPAGQPAKMAATFSIPSTAADLRLSIALYSALPATLSVSEPTG